VNGNKKSKKIKTRALICALVLMMIGITPVILKSPVVRERRDDGGFRMPIYSLDTIPNIGRVFDSVGKTSLGSNQLFSPVTAAILPHHTDIGLYIDQYWAEIAQQSKPELIIIVSPAHWDQGAEAIQTTKGQWETPFGLVKTDDNFIDRFVKRSSVSLEPDSFENEHGIGVHTSYIAHYFPGTPIVPIIAQSRAGITSATKFTQEILKSDKKILLIASIDFSHYLSAEISDRHDEETRRIIANSNLERIDQMGPNYLDSSFALETYLLWNSSTGCRSQERWHNHNARLFPGIQPEEGTSYFVYTCSSRSPLRMSAVGDIMLARGVGRALERMDPATRRALQRTQDLILSVTADSDLTFANLESVLSTKGQPLPKAYVFEADPKQVELFKQWKILALSVANNHSEDYGQEAWEESVDLLRANGLTPIGQYANQPEVSTIAAGGKQIAFFGFQTLTVPFSFEKVQAAIAKAKQTHDVVVVSMHWGEEYQPVPESSTVALAHALVGAGADIVLGHHPHVLQQVEIYKDKLIFYSLGNFVFDQVGEAENKSLIATIDVWEDGVLSYIATPVQIENNFPRSGI
jgi:poly-gamma-glutamate synthesis protein (capsule biosynthesis protein)